MSGWILTPQWQGFQEFHFVWIQGVSGFLGLGKKRESDSLQGVPSCSREPKAVTLCHVPCHHQNGVPGAVTSHVYEDPTFRAQGAVPGWVPVAGSPSGPPGHQVLCPSPGQPWRSRQAHRRTELTHDRKRKGRATYGGETPTAWRSICHQVSHHVVRLFIWVEQTQWKGRKNSPLPSSVEFSQCINF